MICTEKLNSLKSQEQEILNNASFNTYMIRMKTKLFKNIDQSVLFPEYSYIIPNDKLKISLIVEPLSSVVNNIGIISLDKVMKLYDEISIAIISLCRGYNCITKYCNEHHFKIPTNSAAVRGAQNDYVYKVALNVVGAALVECAKSNIIFDQLPEDDIEDILLMNSFLMFDLYALTKNDSFLGLENIIERKVSDLDSFITVPKHIDNDITALCS